MGGFIEYFKRGCKKEEDFRIGLELEHFVVDKNTKKSIGFLGEAGIESILKKLSNRFSHLSVANGHLFGLERKDILITIEPGSQLEVSIVPKKDISDIELIYTQFMDDLLPILEQHNYELINSGYLPYSSINDIVRIPKKRYEYMESYFNKIGSGAKYMMKGTGAIHVSIDYSNESDFSSKYKLAVILSPMIAFVMENTPVFEGKPYNKHLLRDTIWNDVDPVRVSTDSFWKNNEMTFAGYSDFLRQVPLIVDVQKGEEEYTEKTVLGKYANKPISKKNIEHILTMVFPEIRLKSYIEIRTADSNPFEKTVRYLKVIKDVFRSSQKVKEYLEWFSDLKIPEDIREAKKCIREQGDKAIVYGKPIGEWLKIFHMEELKDKNE
ncbi:MAG: hypothetical protein LBR68_04260 [Lachnoclostridium sp.]|jgi:glutamate--cysteine ligase|nr:hypothetical protein [Lachnoclostridium sp.]